MASKVVRLPPPAAPKTMPATSPAAVAKPPHESNLPQGTNEFLEAHRALYEAIFSVSAPYMQHPKVMNNFHQMRERLDVIGFYMNDSLAVITHPELYPVPKAPQPADEAPKPGEGNASPVEE